MARISSNDVEAQVSTLNNMYKKRGIDLVLKYAPRSGYAAIDYNKNGRGTLTLISAVSTRECYDQLEVLINGIQLMGD